MANPNKSAPPGGWIRPRRPGPTRTFDTGGDLRPLLERYALNLLVATRLGSARDDEGKPVAAANRWLSSALATWAKKHGRTSSTFDEDLEALLQASKGRPALAGRAPGRLGRNVATLGTSFGLERAERAVLQFKVALLTVPGFDSVVDLIGPVTSGGAADLLAAATGESAARVGEALERTSALIDAGLLFVAPGTLPVEQKISIHRRLTDLLTGPSLTPRRFADAWLPLAEPPSLTLADYAHLGPTVERLKLLLAAALDRGERGVNVLLHGPTGCGKTELARLLAREVGAELRLAGAEDDNGFSPNIWERLGSLSSATRILGSSRSLLLFDELEDLFESSSGRGSASLRSSKVWFNELLEQSRVPGIWATNAAAAMDPAILRRFVMAVELPPLDEARRAAVWVRETGGELSGEEATRLARRFEVNPASITSAIRAARLIGSGRVDGRVAEEVLAGNVAASGAPPTKPPPSGLRYEPGLLNASMDLDVLAKRLESAGPSAHATICLHGPPGTGKSEWVRHLAARLQRKIHVHAVSDIESKYVGESETNLARAFERAEQENALLLFDEADSFLLDRRNGHRRWEISLTNEFLQRLEAARGVVACTTNAFDRLDPAVMRRFSIKVGLDYLKPDAAVRLFAVAFGPILGALDADATARVGRLLRHVGPFAPGDFATVSRRADLLPEPLTVEVLVEELAQEVAARKGSLAKVAGFRGGC